MASADKELESYRNLMQVPSTFEEGFSLSSFVGVVFVALIMVPGAIYMELMAGMEVGPAAQWVTVILFVEVAKRANQVLSKAQIFVLFYLSGNIVNNNFDDALLFTQFFVQSDAAVAFGFSADIPIWVAPTDPDILSQRSFLQLAWMPALGLFIFKKFFSRFDAAVLGYGLFRITSDVEKLPFPMAPIGAAGIIALSEDLDGKSEDSWRWRAFSIGGALGMVFGTIYMGIPTISGAFLGQTFQVFPIPFAELTPYTEDFLPAVATNFSFDLGGLVFGMVMPYFAMVGSFIGLLVTLVLNPILHSAEMLPMWAKGMSTVETTYANNIDFYMSFGIGLSLAVAIVGIVSAFRKSQAKVDKREEMSGPPVGRGDIGNKWIIITYVVSTAAYIGVSGYLIDWHTGVMWLLLFYAFLYTPMISYVTARLEGMAGQVIEIPFIRELSFILSGYQGIAIWFIPIPKANFGIQTVFYRKAELTGTKFTSIWKADVVLFPVVVLAMVGFSSYIWSLGEIPSAVYPYTQEMWEFQAKTKAVTLTATMSGYSEFDEAIKPGVIAAGGIIGLVTFVGLAFFNAPTLLCYGVVRGLGQSLPYAIIPNFIGALIGRYYFERKLGLKWRQYVPVVAAGFSCGFGLLSMFCIGIVFLSKASSSLLY